MTIFYALLAKQKNIILAEFTEYNGNFQQYTMQLMQRIELDTKKTFELEEYLFHYINDDGLSVLCMTDKQMPKKVAFAFMQDLRKSLLKTYTARELGNAKAYQLSTFTDTIREKMVSFKLCPQLLLERTRFLTLKRQLRGRLTGCLTSLL